MSPWFNGMLSLLLIGLGGVRLAGGLEQEAVVVDVTASKYDTRSGLEKDDAKGCFLNGCEPALMIDGILNNVLQSRWSCETDLPGSIEQCYATFDLGEPFTLTKLVLYFRESNDTSREANPFIISTSLTDVTYDEAFSGVNVPGTALEVGEEFPFPNSTTGRYVRLEAELEADQWISVNEAILFHEVDGPTPTPVPSVSTTQSPTAEIYVDSDTVIETPTDAPTPAVASMPPTAAGTPFGCSTITLSGAGELSGTYVSSATSSLEATYALSADSSTVMSRGESSATCTDALTNCMATFWLIASDGENKYMVYDDAVNPSLIEELWISLDCSEGTCQNSPADLSVVCGDGTASLEPTPSPVATDASDCGVLEVNGTSQGTLDGLYYDDGAGATTDAPSYSGFDTDGTSNGNAVSARSVDGACSSASTSTASLAATGESSGCKFRQWWVSAADSSISGTDSVEASYFTYDEADHPADIQGGGLWYTSNGEVLPYAGEVVITCVPATTPTLSPSDINVGGSPMPSPSPSPSSGTVDGDDTRAPVGNSTVDRTVSTEGNSDGGSSGSTEVIVGSVVGGVALLAILGAAVVYKMKRSTPPPPPPSYDDLVGA